MYAQYDSNKGMNMCCHTSGINMSCHTFSRILLFMTRSQEGGLSFHTFLECFGGEQVGRFNPFKPNVPIDSEAG
jgi:hypothetical protein